MTGYLAWIFLILMLLKTVMKLVLNGLNTAHLTKMKGQVPKELKGLVKSADLKKIDAYSREKTIFSNFSELYGTLIAAVFLFTPLFPAYAGWISSLNFPWILSGILFFVFLSWIRTVLSLPFSAYYHFKLEGKYGFNRYTTGVFFLDILKKLTVNTLISAVLLTPVLLLIGKEPGFTITRLVLLWGISLVLTVLLMFIVPVVILPFLYKLKPLKKRSLLSRVKALVRKSGFRVRGIFEADESRRSAHANASFSGLGKSKTIVLFDTLLKDYTDPEILGVLAHEIGHGKKGHILQSTILSVLMSWGFLWVALAVLSSSALYGMAGLSGLEAAVPGLLFLLQILFFDLMLFWVNPLFAGLSRKHEYEADEYSRKLLGSSAGLVSTFKKFIVKELSQIHPHPVYEAFYYSHPSLLKRIRALQFADKKLIKKKTRSTKTVKSPVKKKKQPGIRKNKLA